MKEKGINNLEPLTAMKDVPLVSVIVPVYNVEKYLDKCIESIVSQTYHNIEVLLIDDGSPDHCPEICDLWAAKDGRIKVIHKSNGGVSSARNAGIDAAQGLYLCFIDGDDFVHSQYVELMLSNLLATDADISLCSSCNVRDNEEYTSNKENSLTICSDEDEILKVLFVNAHFSTIVPWGKLYKREIFGNDLRYDIGKLHEDEYIAHKIYIRCKRIVLTSAQLYYYFYREGSITLPAQFTEKNLDWFYAIENRYLYFKGSKWEQMALDRVIMSAAQVYYVARDRRANEEILNLLREKFKFYYNQNKHKKLFQRVFRYCPFLFCKLKKIKEKRCIR